MVVAVVRAPLWAALFLGPLMSYCVFLVCAVAGPPTRILKPWAGVWVGGCCGRFFFLFFSGSERKNTLLWARGSCSYRLSWYHTIGCVGLGVVGGCVGPLLGFWSNWFLIVFVSVPITVFFKTAHGVDRSSISGGVVPTVLLALLCGNGSCYCILCYHLPAVGIFKNPNYALPACSIHQRATV